VSDPYLLYLANKNMFKLKMKVKYLKINLNCTISINYLNWMSRQIHLCLSYFLYSLGARRGRDSMIVGFITTTNVRSSNPVHGEVYSIQHYVMKFVSDLQQVGDFLRVFRFPPTIKRTATI